MTCPSCGRIAAAGLQRCARCGSSLEIPAARTDIPVVRGPTNRGELAQRAAGIFAKSLVPPRPAPAGPPPGPDLAPPAVPTPAGLPPRPPVPLPAPGLAAASDSALDPTAALQRPGWAPTETANPASGAIVTPPPPPDVSVAPAQAAAAPSPVPPVDVTAVLPAGAYPPGSLAGARDQPPAPDPAREEPTEEARPRVVRPGVDPSWPPPPGPWSGRRTTES